MVAIWENSKMTPWLDLIGGYSKASHYLFLNNCWDPITYRLAAPARVLQGQARGVSLLQAAQRRGDRVAGGYALGGHGLDCYLGNSPDVGRQCRYQCYYGDFCQKMFPSVRTSSRIPESSMTKRVATKRAPTRKSQRHRRREGRAEPQAVAERGLACLDKLRKKVRTADTDAVAFLCAVYAREVLEYAIKVPREAMRRSGVFSK